MKKVTKTRLKIAVSIFVASVMIFISWVFLLFFFSFGHTFQKFNSVQSIDNWDVTRGSATGDFDNDGKKDLITREGCAYLTKANINKIPQANQCSDVYTNEMYKGQFPTLGQKYVFSANYTYIAMQKNGTWLIESVFSPTRIYIYKIGPDGMLTHSPTPLIAVMDSVLYGIILLPIYIIILIISII